jgi:hypothetical protein
MKRFPRIVAVALAVSLLPGCMLSRLVDRAFLGITVRRPSLPDRKTTGIFLLPITFAVDVVTFPLQALLVVILGDNFPFPETGAINNTSAMAANETFQELDAATQAIALAELDELLRSGQVTPSTALVLKTDGHWTLVLVDDEARAQLMARAAHAEPATQVCER